MFSLLERENLAAPAAQLIVWCAMGDFHTALQARRTTTRWLLLPCLAVGLGALYVTVRFRDTDADRSLEAAEMLGRRSRVPARQIIEPLVGQEVADLAGHYTLMCSGFEVRGAIGPVPCVDQARPGTNPVRLRLADSPNGALDIFVWHDDGTVFGAWVDGPPGADGGAAQARESRSDAQYFRIDACARAPCPSPCGFSAELWLAGQRAGNTLLLDGTMGTGVFRLDEVSGNFVIWIQGQRLPLQRLMRGEVLTERFRAATRGGTLETE